MSQARNREVARLLLFGQVYAAAVEAGIGELLQHEVCYVGT
jgi:hypothetical protein